jgi:hypothetical protein
MTESVQPIAIAHARPRAPEPEWRRHGRGEHRRVGGLHVLRLRGSFGEMVLREHIAGGPIPYYRSHFTKLVGRSAMGPLAPLVWPTLQMLIGRRVARNIPAFAEETIAGIARGAGLSVQDLMDGCTMPDSMLWLACARPAPRSRTGSRSASGARRRSRGATRRRTASSSTRGTSTTTASAAGRSTRR